MSAMWYKAFNFLLFSRFAIKRYLTLKYTILRDSFTYILTTKQTWTDGILQLAPDGIWRKKLELVIASDMSIWNQPYL
jgi:hypothetical protein